MNTILDGPASPHFTPLQLNSRLTFDNLAGESGFPQDMLEALKDAPRGSSVSWGIPFEIANLVLIQEGGATFAAGLEPFSARWLVFLHTSGAQPLERDASGFIPASPGNGRLNEPAAVYSIEYTDGSQVRAEIRRRHQVGTYRRNWGENCFQAVEQHKPYPVRASHEQLVEYWGRTQTRVEGWSYGPWINWLWAWENPHPEKAICGLHFTPQCGTVILSAVSAGEVIEHPLRWQRRQKAVFFLRDGEAFEPRLDGEGLLAQIRLDLGQVISAQQRAVYPNTTWTDSYNNRVPATSESEVLVEYTAHSQACFHLAGGKTLAVAELEHPGSSLQPVAPAHQRILLRVVDQATGRPVAVKLHLHGEWGEYLPPVDSHRIINDAWFEDYSVDFLHLGQHPCTYIAGETVVDLPQGRVYVEISKGFEARPVRTVIEIGPETSEVTIPLEKVLPWREAGWVTADTHVHFLTPGSALLEGAGEGVNVVNLLASQWGELMTNVGDFDGHTTWGAGETAGPEGNGEWLVRVGTENRQHVLGHISLLGYRGRIIAPMTTAGPDESALGDPLECLLTEWARQCKAQDGLVVLPHFPNPRAEHAASIVSGDIDALEMTAWGDLYSGIDPYSLSDWYRYLNCGYPLAAVGGTDKMWAGVAVGTVRTYARIPREQPFTYQAWMEAVRRRETFVTYGPLIDFAVNGMPMGSQIELPPGGGTLDVTWQAASVTVPVKQVDLIVNGEVRQSALVNSSPAGGSWSFKVDKASWLALLVRGGYADQTEMIAAHSSPVMVAVPGTQLMAAADAVTILEQVEGALAYLDTIGTRAEDRAYKRMRLVLLGAHRSLHNRLHQMGYFHEHIPGIEDP